MSSSSHARLKNKPKIPSKLRTVVTAKSSKPKSNSSSSRSSPPPPPPLPPQPSFTSTNPNPKKKKESYISTGKRLIFSKDNPNGFLEYKNTDDILILMYEIINKDGKTREHKITYVTPASEIKKIKENNKKMLKEMGILTHHQYTIPTGGKKTHKHRKGKKYYKKRTLRKRK